MGGRGRARQRIGVAAGAAATLVLIAVMILSGRWTAYWRAPAGWYAGVRCGMVVMGRNTQLGLRGAGIGRHRDGLRWWPRISSDEDLRRGTPATFFYLYLPLWPLAAAAALPPGLAGIRLVRGAAWARRGRCRACGYDLRAIAGETATDGARVSVRCPECGAVAPRAMRPMAAVASST
jgi:hypothetical protein